jgi:PAS domain S-box-containing protein
VAVADGKRCDLDGSFSSEDLARLRGEAIASYGHHAVIDLDANGTIVGWNHVAEAFLGYPRAEALGRGAALLLPEQSDPEALDVLVDLSHQPPDADPFLLNYRRRDGEVRHLGYSAAPLRTSEGVIAGWTVIARDLTELGRSRWAMIASEARYRTMVEGALEGVGTSDRDGRITYANRQLAEMTGYEPGEEIGRRVEDMLFPEDVPAYRDSMHRAGLGESDVSEVRFRRKDGSVLWTIKATSPVLDEAGQYAGSVCFFTDITARKEAEAALRESEARRRAYFEHAAVGIMLATLQGRIQEVNPALCQLIGYSRDELTGGDLSTLLPGELTPQVRAELREVVVGSKPYFQVEQPFVTRSAKEVLLDVTGSAIRNEQGRVVEMVLVVQDVTERKAAERTKDEFVSVVSHELRTPLTSLRGALGLLAGGTVGQMPATAQRMLDVAVGSTDRLIRLVNDILDLERLSAGQLTLSMGACEAAVLVSRAVEELRGAADAASVEVHIGSVEGRVYADADRITQTLANLIGNAIKFSPSLGRVWLSATPENGQVLFVVQDQGRGIPDDQLEAIFGRFQQVDASDAREKGGAGLGLAICRSLVEQHGGRIWAENAEGGGTRLSFTVPAAREVGVVDQQPSVRSVSAGVRR